MSTRQVYSQEPYDRFEEAINDLQSYEAPHASRAVALPYQAPDEHHDDALAYEPVPLFLSNYEDDEQPKHRFGSGGESRNVSRAMLWSRILKGGIAAACAAGIALAISSMDNPLAVFSNAKASLANDTSGQLSATDLAAAPPSVAAQPPAPEPAPNSATPRRIQPAGLGSVSPSRDEIAAAYQGAIKSKVTAVEPATQATAPAAAPAAAAPPPAARSIAPDELAALLKRAKGLLAIGDITSARLLLERAADAQEAEAALMLAGTYDPQVLGTQDMRSITPDPAAARLWYQKAAQLGSVDARRRLQSQN